MRVYITRGIITIFLIICLLPLQVSAADSRGLQVDGEGKVTLPSLEAAEEGMSSLSFSFYIESPGAADIQFQFQEGNGAIQEFRYDKEKGKLNIYVAGAEDAIPKNGELMDIGRIVVLDSNGNDKGVEATVYVTAGSLKYVCGTELKWMKDLETQEEMKMVSAGWGAAPTPSPIVPTPSPIVPTPSPIVPTTSPSEPSVTPTQSPTVPIIPPVVVPVPTPTPEPEPDWEEQPEENENPSSAPGQTTQPVRTPLPVQTARPGSVPGTIQVVTPVPVVSPSATPEASGSQETESDSSESESAEVMIPAANEGLENEEKQEESSGQGLDWVFVAAVIAIALFVIVAVMAIVVLKGGARRRDTER